MNQGHSGQAATLLSGGRVLIAGGYLDEVATTDSAELYDPESGEFSLTGSMTIARVSPFAALLKDGDVLIAGGAQGIDQPDLASAELYDPRTGTFRSTGSMSTPRSGADGCVLHDGRVLVVGGNAYGTPSAEIYRP
jgi:hypothetical protein